MGQHKVLSGIELITRPRDEVINLPTLFQPPTTVETGILLHILQQGHIGTQIRTLTAKEEQPKVNSPSEDRSILTSLTNPPDPSALNECLDLVAELSQAVGYTGP